MPASAPLVSVFMPVYNGEPHLRDAIAGVLDQTLNELELVVVENGSTDGSRETALRAARHDRRVRVIEHDEPLGIVGAANAGIAAARAPIVARHDQDDLSHPRRLERQVEALDRFPGAVAVGTLCDGIDTAGRRVRPRDRWRLVGRHPLPPFPHGSACMRRSAFDRVGGYREHTYSWEDIDLFLRLVQIGDVLVLPEALYHYRFHTRSLTAAGDRQDADGAALMWRAVDEFRRGRDWSHLLDGNQVVRVTTRDAARSARHADGMKLWSGVPIDGEAPGATTTGARIRRNWQRASPATLRRAVWTAIVVRDLAVAPFVPRQRPVSWRPR